MFLLVKLLKGFFRSMPAFLVGAIVGFYLAPYKEASYIFFILGALYLTVSTWQDVKKSKVPA